MEKHDPSTEIETANGAAHSTVRDAMRLLDQSSTGQVPLLDPMTGEVVAILVSPDVQLPVLSTPEVPRFGGMATPLGVYLHDGTFGGGAGFLGLALTGVLLGSLSLVAKIATGWIGSVIDGALAHAPATSKVALFFGPAGIGVDRFVFELFSVYLLLLVLVRLLPLAGTHAAEHQVVHCVEQRAPLTLQYVRTMPRVHPRCGTNVLTGMLIFLASFITVFHVAIHYNQSLSDAATFGAIVAGPLTLIYWRRAGGFIQYWLATKTASDRQIYGAIKAAEQVFARQVDQDQRPLRFETLRRIWSTGLAQISIGYSVVYFLLNFVRAHWPWFGATLEI